MKYVASVLISAVVALALPSAARAQPTDNSESGMSRGSVVGSDYWAEVFGDRQAPASGVRYRSGGVRSGGFS